MKGLSREQNLRLCSYLVLYFPYSVWGRLAPLPTYPTCTFLAWMLWNFKKFIVSIKDICNEYAHSEHKNLKSVTALTNGTRRSDESSEIYLFILPISPTIYLPFYFYVTVTDVTVRKFTPTLHFFICFHQTFFYPKILW